MNAAQQNIIDDSVWIVLWFDPRRVDRNVGVHGVFDDEETARQEVAAMNYATLATPSIVYHAVNYIVARKPKNRGLRHDERAVDNLNENAMLTLAASAIAHRICIHQEHDPNNGKVHGCCVVCGDPWPCDTAKRFLNTNTTAFRPDAPAPAKEVTP
jgi:hypothetical protein